MAEYFFNTKPYAGMWLNRIGHLTGLPEHARLLLEDERLVVVFPEGYPNVDPTFTPKTGPDEFLPFKPGFISIVACAERRLNAKVPIIPAGIRYENGHPWMGYLKLGEPVYRDKFSTKTLLINFLETEVKRLSAAIDA